MSVGVIAIFHHLCPWDVNYLAVKCEDSNLCVFSSGNILIIG
jgi:hypothetical protein